jgi:hypothetical protein
MGPKMNKDSYVFTNPPKDTELFSCDKVYVLSQAPINSGRLGGGRRNQMAGMDSELIEKEIMYMRALRKHRDFVESTVDSIAQVRSDIGYLDEVHSDMQTQLDVLASRFDARSRVLLSVLKELNGGRELRCLKSLPSTFTTFHNLSEKEKETFRAKTDDAAAGNRKGSLIVANKIKINLVFLVYSL